MRAALGVAVLVLGGCTTLSQVSGTQAVAIGALQVTPPTTWSQVTRTSLTGGSHVVVLTKDGQALDKLCFIAGLEDNQSIHADRSGKPPEPRFHKWMTASEVMELFEAAYARPEGSPVIFNVANLRPDRFAGGDGFRFDFSFIDQADEVERKGIAAGTVRDGKLYLIFYHGARIHFFAKNLAEVEAIIRSARLL